MSDQRKLVRAHMRSVIKWFGCLDAAVATINAHWDMETSKGTLSKKQSGQLDFTVADVIALEDASGQFPITKMLARRLEVRDDEIVNCLIEQAGVIAKEAGEAVQAILAAQKSQDPKSTAQAAKQLDDIISAATAARDTVLRQGQPVLISGGE